RLVAFYASLYFAGLRPEEAAALAARHLALPSSGSGWLHLDGAKPHAGKDWTDTGGNRDERQLKQRARGEVRTVPCPPELTELIHDPGCPRTRAWTGANFASYSPGAVAERR